MIIPNSFKVPTEVIEAAKAHLAWLGVYDRIYDTASEKTKEGVWFNVVHYQNKELEAAMKAGPAFEAALRFVQDLREVLYVLIPLGDMVTVENDPSIPF